MRNQTISKRISFKGSYVMMVVLIAIIASLDAVLFAHTGLQELTVASSTEGKRYIGPREQIELKLARGVNVSSIGRLAVLIGRTDVTSLLIVSDNVVRYTPKFVPLPEGETQLIVYLVSPENEWKEIARFPLRVENVGSADSFSQDHGGNASIHGPPSTGPAGRKSRFERAAITPSITIGMKSQAMEFHFPASNRPSRPTFADTTLQASIRSDLSRAFFNSRTQFDVAGTSFRQEALRFGTEGDNAPLIDLSSYLMQFQIGKAKVNVGHIVFGSNRHVINSFSSRGISLLVPITKRSDFSLAAMNGTSIVGWNNFFGLSKRKHQFVSGNLGFEFIPERAGGLRIETSVLDGRLLPVSNFNQGNVTDTERSRGLGLRFLASDKAQRFRLDGGFARSGFTNPADPLLYQGRDVVAVREVIRNARYLDASYTLIQSLAVTETKKASVTVNYRHERVDPLFRSIAAFTQADRLQNQVDVVAAMGDVTATISHVRFNDNLSDIPSILKSLSRRTNLILGTPLNSLIGNAARPSPWFPRISYSFDETHQFASAIPINGGFESNLSTVPDQVSINQNINADWQWGRARFGYRFNRSFQDNRQSGREQADLRNLINGITFGINPSAAIDLSFDLNAESALNKEMRRTDTTLRFGSNINWQMTKNMSLATLVSTTGAGATGGVVSNRSAELDLQWSYRWGLEKSRFKKAQGQLFIRYANRYARTLDRVFGFNNLLKLQTLNAGLSFTFF